MKAYEYSYQDAGYRVCGLIAARDEIAVIKVIRGECPDAYRIKVNRAKGFTIDKDSRIIRRRERQ